MQLSPHVLATTLWAIVSVVRAGEHSYLTNFRTVYHGHGATSYQNVHIENGKSEPRHGQHAVVHAEADHLIDSRYGDPVALFIAIPSEHEHEVHLPAKVEYQDIVLDQGEPSVHGAPEYYNSYEGEHEYEYYR